MKHILLGFAVVLLPLAAQADGAAEDLYQQGATVYKTNPPQAYELFVKAAELGHPQALAATGHCYETGTGTATNYAKAIEWYENAVEINSITACEGLARIYASCPDPKFHDGEKAVKYATPVARKKPRDAESLALLAAAYVRNMEFEKAVKASEKAWRTAPLDKGDELKTRHKEYLLGIPFPAVATEAWILEAANNSSAWAMSRLSDRYEDIDSSMYDLASARLWCEKAAKKGKKRDDLFQIGRYCVYGIGGLMEVEKGMRYLEQAGELGSDQANAEMGDICLVGIKVPRNPDRAFKYYSLMESVDDKIVMHKRDLLSSDNFRSFLKDAEPNKLHELGTRYCTPLEGNRVRNAQGRFKQRELNYRKALVYYIIAAEQGYIPAMQSVAVLCFEGGRFDEVRLRLKKEGFSPADIEATSNLREIKPYLKEAARWYFELAKIGDPHLPSRTHESFAEMAKWYNELARRDGSVPLLEID